MNKIRASVVSLNVGAGDGFGRQPLTEIDVELDGIVGDHHGGYLRQAFSGDKQPKGTVRRNERQWSAVSLEELAQIQSAMDLTEMPSAADLGANLCFAGLRQLSRLPRGSLLKFPSGAELIVEEYNPPCMGMGKRVADKYSARSGKPVMATAFSQAAKLSRGIVGVVEVPGKIRTGDDVEIEIFATPSWLLWEDD